MAQYVASSVDTYSEFDKIRSDKRKEAILQVGGVAAAGFGANYFLNTDQGQEIAGRLFKLNTLNDYFRFDGNLWTDLKVKQRITLGDLALNAVKTLEEISPLKILRTFHASSFISPFVVPNESVPIHITADQLLLDRGYFRTLIKEKGNNVATSDIDDLFRHGAVFENGKLLSHDRSTTILEHAKIVNLAPAPVATPDANTPPFINRTYQKFRNIIGDRADSFFYNAALSDKGGIGIIAGSTPNELKLNWTRAQGRLYLEPSFKLFDRPLDILAEVMDKTGLPDKFPGLSNLRSHLAINMGTGGDYTGSISSSFLEMSKRIGKATIAGAIGYTLIDQLAKTASTSDSPYSKGILPGLATGYTNMRTTVASVWSDNFQGYKEKQEYLAEGSTQLSTLAGFPLAGALAGAMYGYGTRVTHASRDGIAAADLAAHTEGESGFVNRVFRKTAGNGPKLNKTSKYAAIGAILAAIPILPFLPGALIGESSESLEAKYSGEEDIAIRSTRFWGSGGVGWEGGKIKYFTKSWYAQLMSGAETAGQYGDEETKDRLNPILHPLDYLRNPYRKEELNQDKSPYPVWGMEVSYGGAFGKLFQGTLGRVIKPDIVNNRLDDYLEDGGSAKGRLQNGESLELKTQVTDNEASLIEEGKMLAPVASSLTLNTELAHTSYSALTDFAGLKGWVSSLAASELQTGLGEPNLQLGRSGEMSNSAREIKESNLGGMGPVGESLRRFIPTNAGSVLDRSNPLRNQMPEWMPHDINNYWLDFSTGDPYRTVEKGYLRLPGEGYATLFPELKGLDPKDYPLIHKFKILSDVAMGSNEYYDTKDIFEAKAAAGELTGYEQNIYNKIVQQTADRSVQKDFYDANQGSAVSGYWDALTNVVEAPTESLTFLRPGAKLVHKRSALEDYIDTQVEGNDVGMWTNPYSDFIKPTINKIVQEDYVPEEVQDKRAINSYFDKLEYYKYRKLYKEAVKTGDTVAANDYKKKYQTTLTGALTTGLDDNMEVTRAYIAMPTEERAYFSAFSGFTSEEDRRKVIDLESTDIADLYSRIWKRRDAITENANSPDAQARAVQSIVEDETSELQRSNPGLYAKYKATANSSTSSFAEFVADSQAEDYIKSVTGMPDASFSGWDPRIDIKDIKLRTLELGKEDVRSYGFWQGDEDRVNRLVAVRDERQVTTEIDEIKQGIREEKSRAAAIKSDLYKRGISVSNVDFHTSKNQDINMNIGA